MLTRTDSLPPTRAGTRDEPLRTSAWEATVWTAILVSYVPRGRVSGFKTVRGGRLGSLPNRPRP